MTGKRRVIFFAEPATLAHVVRPLVLAQALDRERFEVSFATGTDFRHHIESAGLDVRDLWCMGTRAYLAAVSAGRPVFPYEVLERYVEDDLRVIGEFRPDVIVGDFRLSLAVSARLAKIPYVGISNAYWSPYAQARFEVPVHAATRLLGVGFSDSVFQLVRPLIFAQHCLPMHRLRQRHGMSSLGFDLRRVFTEADLTLFADVPELVPTQAPGMEDRYRYIGPITWSPAAPVPETLLDSEDSRPLVYVALGSSGDESVRDAIVDALVSLGCRVAVAAARDQWSQKHGDSVVVRNLLPGAAMAALAKLVICNGVSPAVNQALGQGKPVIGIPSNLDQLLNMGSVVRWGSGVAVRADQTTCARVRYAAKQVLEDPSFTARAREAQQLFAAFCAVDRFAAALQ